MLTADGPRVLEYNVRFGDPEAQVILPLLREDPVEVLLAVAEGHLGRAVPAGRLAPPRGAAICVVMVAGGYPGSPLVGQPIRGLGPEGQLAEPVPGVTVVHAGTRRESAEGPFLVGGGRVLGITASAPDLAEARRRAYAGVERVSWPGARWRSDVAAAAGVAEGSHVPDVPVATSSATSRATSGATSGCGFSSTSKCEAL
jgi:phosphoribosylamine--glycine ligase